MYSWTLFYSLQFNSITTSQPHAKITHIFVMHTEGNNKLENMCPIGGKTVSDRKYCIHVKSGEVSQI
jgi:hypothetical protein